VKLFDSLTHITENGKWFNTDHDSSLTRLLHGKKTFEKAMLVGMPSLLNNEYTLSVSKEFQDVFVPIYGIEFKNKTFLILREEIKKIKRDGYRGIKIHPRLCETQWDDEILIDVINTASEYDLIVLFCTVYGKPLKPLKRPVYDVIYDICYKTEGSKIILLHGGYTELLQTAEIVRPFENVLVDLSYTIVRFKHSSLINDIKYLFHNFENRICLGSDYPECDQRDLIKTLEDYVLDRDDFSDDVIENATYNNLNNFIKG